MKRLRNEGFTIIELLIATVIFAVVLLVISGAIVQFGRIYYKGTLSSKTQETARNIIEDISQSIQFSGGNIPDSTGSVFCAGGRRFSYAPLGTMLTSSNHVLLADRVDTCTSVSPRSLVTALNADPANVATELLGTNMRIARLSVAETSNGSGLYKITVRIVNAGADDLLEDNFKADGSAGTDSVLDSCKSVVGNQFCSVSELETIVSRRL